MHNTKDTLATNPLPISSFNSGIIEDRSFVKPEASLMLILAGRDFIWVEVVKAGSANYFIRLITQDVDNRFGSK
jgi:hypothetical protein